MCAHNTSFHKIPSCSYFNFPNELQLHKVINFPQPSWRRQKHYSMPFWNTRMGVHTNRGPEPMPRSMETIQWVRRQIRKCLLRDSRGFKEACVNWWSTGSPGKVKPSSTPVIPKPRGSCPTPEWSLLRHSGTPYGSTLSHRMWQIVQQLPFWHFMK